MHRLSLALANAPDVPTGRVHPMLTLVTANHRGGLRVTIHLQGCPTEARGHGVSLTGNVRGTMRRCAGRNGAKAAHGAMGREGARGATESGRVKLERQGGEKVRGALTLRQTVQYLFFTNSRPQASQSIYERNHLRHIATQPGECRAGQGSAEQSRFPACSYAVK